MGPSPYPLVPVSSGKAVAQGWRFSRPAVFSQTGTCLSSITAAKICFRVRRFSRRQGRFSSREAASDGSPGWSRRRNPGFQFRKIRALEGRRNRCRVPSPLADLLWVGVDSTQRSAFGAGGAGLRPAHRKSRNSRDSRRPGLSGFASPHEGTTAERAETTKSRNRKKEETPRSRNSGFQSRLARE